MEACLINLKAAASTIYKYEINLSKTPRERRNAAYIQARSDVLEQHWQHYLATYHQFSEYPEAAESAYIKTDVFSDVQECHLEAKTTLYSWAASIQVGSSSSSVQPVTPPAVQSSGRLPKLEIPHFSGELREWETFRDLFTAMVHEHAGLKPAVKLQYLKANVTGEASLLLRNIPVSDANYADAWNALAARYNNPRILVQGHVRALHSIASVSKESAEGIKGLLDATNECVRALKNLKQPVEHWDAILVDLTCQRLDQLSRRDWETSLADSTAFPTWKQLSTFLETRVRALEAARPPTTYGGFNSAAAASSKQQKPSVSSHVVSTNQENGGRKKARKCLLCAEPHYIGACPQYKVQDLQQRLEHVRRLRLCRNCLGGGHLAAACPSTKRCNLCGTSHHTTLHQEMQSFSKPETTPQRSDVSSEHGGSASTSVQSHHASTSRPRARTVLLGTALVDLASPAGRRVPARVLIDPCSEGSFVSEAKVQALRAPRTAAIVPVRGVSGFKVGVAKSLVGITVSPRSDPSVSISVVACVLPTVAGDLPARETPRQPWTHLVDLALADPEYDKPGKIDMILGADVYRELLLSGVRFGSPGSPLAQQTVLGWILTGPVLLQRPPSSNLERGLRVHHSTLEDDLSGLVRKFWELEELPAQRHLTEDEEDCEIFFRETQRRDETGRYVVRLPLRSDPRSSLGESRAQACGALVRGERLRQSEPQTEGQYSKFLAEYLAMGHMEAAPSPRAGDRAPHYYMPHHAVVREVEGERKLRVVFNASHPSSTGKSLNDLLRPGPKLQADIMTVLMRWRRHCVVFAADIVKMFRQIRVAKEDCDLQRIVWRASPGSQAQDAHLLTVTYGTACAPYLAIRTLQQLATDEGRRFPMAVPALLRDTYIDDTLTGADDLLAARELKTALAGLLKSGGFELSKWLSNRPELLFETSETGARAGTTRELDPEQGIRTLGVVWSPSDDSFRVKLNLEDDENTATKRTLLSELARTFDPLGWLAPVLVQAKILFQDSWLTGAGWDEPLPADLLAAWLKLRATLPRLEDLAIPRWLGPTLLPRRYQLHGFSDASERAYCAAVYIRSTAEDGTNTVSLLIAKTKVAPVKSVSLPRLELCGAVLLARQLAYVQRALSDDLDQESFAWSDSTVTLAWLRGHPSRWVTFVANRVAEIHTILPFTTWRHVKSAENPADLATRGITPENLIQAKLWWQGPGWLANSPAAWPPPECETTVLEARVERRIHAVFTVAENDVLGRFSRLHRLLRVTAWCLRIRQRRSPEPRSDQRELRPLCATEIAAARQRWILVTQREAYHEEISALQKGQRLPTRSTLSRLNPFLDEQGALRLGGRLHGAELLYGERHPVILPGSSRFTGLLIRQAHEATLHGGPQLTMSYLLRFCWIPSGRNKVRAAVHRCTKCARYRATAPQQLMGQLPASRITRPSRPFARTGLDYAGPFLLRASSGRGRTTYKAYIALFVCLATRAVHLEVVGNYSTDAFLAAFKRFASRRGICAELYSDNGTNFHGADRELRALFLAASAASREIAAALAQDGTRWHFIPPTAPHFGGIWEAGVKSTKHHLRRVIGDTKMTYEEFATVVTQIEGCLNSRPLCPLSNDPADLVALTPGHFLCAGAPASPPEPSVLHLPHNRLARWQLTTHMVESFWRRWSTEYLHQLQQRTKWTTAKPNFVTGDLVLLRTSLLPPAKWPLARVEATHPGSDGLVRVVTVRTATSTFRRPIAQVVLLPEQDPDTP